MTLPPTVHLPSCKDLKPSWHFFGRASQECVSLREPSGCEFARCLVSIAAAELSALLAGGAESPKQGSSGGEGCRDAPDDYLPCDLSLAVAIHRSVAGLRSFVCGQV